MKCFFFPSLLLSVVMHFTCYVKVINGHGAMIEPPMRSVMWKYGFDTPANYNYMELYCGGFENFRRHDGKCGLCGDPFQGPYENDRGGKYDLGVIARSYPAGQPTIKVKVELSAHHMGYFRFYLCPSNENQLSIDCLRQHRLRIVEGTEQGDATKYYPPHNQVTYDLTIELPRGVTCERCVLQWRYKAGNSWGTARNGTSCQGCGLQETFVNCADISIGGNVDKISTIASSDQMDQAVEGWMATLVEDQGPSPGFNSDVSPTWTSAHSPNPKPSIARPKTQERRGRIRSPVRNAQTRLDPPRRSRDWIPPARRSPQGRLSIPRPQTEERRGRMRPPVRNTQTRRDPPSRSPNWTPPDRRNPSDTQSSIRPFSNLSSNRSTNFLPGGKTDHVISRNVQRNNNFGSRRRNPESPSARISSGRSVRRNEWRRQRERHRDNQHVSSSNNSGTLLNNLSDTAKGAVEQNGNFRAAPFSPRSSQTSGKVNVVGDDISSNHATQQNLIRGSGLRGSVFSESMRGNDNLVNRGSGLRGSGEANIDRNIANRGSGLRGSAMSERRHGTSTVVNRGSGLRGSESRHRDNISPNRRSDRRGSGREVNQSSPKDREVLAGLGILGSLSDMFSVRLNNNFFARNNYPFLSPYGVYTSPTTGRNYIVVRNPLMAIYIADVHPELKDRIVMLPDMRSKMSEHLG